MASFFAATRPDHCATPSTNPLPSWGFETLDQLVDSPATPSVAPAPLFGDGTAPIVASSSSFTQVPQAQEPPQHSPPRDLVLAAVSTDATGKQSAKKI
jgi:hypothetical protein